MRTPERRSGTLGGRTSIGRTFVQIKNPCKNLAGVLCDGDVPWKDRSCLPGAGFIHLLPGRAGGLRLKSQAGRSWSGAGRSGAAGVLGTRHGIGFAGMETLEIVLPSHHRFFSFGEGLRKVLQLQWEVYTPREICQYPVFA